MFENAVFCKEGTRLRATHLPSGMYYNYRTVKKMVFNHAIDMAVNGLVLSMYECPHNLFAKYLVNKNDGYSLEEVLATQYNFVDAFPKRTSVPNVYNASVILRNGFGRYSFELRGLLVQELTEEEAHV